MSDTIEIVEGAPEQIVSNEGLFKSEEDQKAFVDFLVKEITAVRDGEDIAEFMANVQIWRRMRIARPENPIKNTPFPNSANVSPPIMAQRVNTVYAKLLKNFSTKRPFWSGDSADATYKPHAEALSRYLNALSASPFHLNLEALNRKAFYDLPSLGTQFYEVFWDYQRLPVLEGDNKTPAYRVIKNGPAIELIKIEDFFTRPYWDDLQRAPWLAIRFRLTWGELQERASSGRFMNVDKVLSSPLKEFTEEEKLERERLGINASPAMDFDSTKVFDLYRFHAFWDVNGDGILEDIKGVIELESGTLLRVETNNLGYRLVGRIPFFEIPGQLYGIGLGHQLQYLQDEAETLHNMRLDNLKLAMLDMYVAPRGSGVTPNETMYPGKIIFMDKPDEFKRLMFPDLSGSSYQAEFLVNQYADRISGANDALAGMADQTLKSGGGAEAQKFMASMASTILDAQFDTVETYYAEMGRMLVLLLARNRDLVDYSMVSESDAALIQEVFNLTPEELPFKFKFKIETTDVARSEEMRKQNFAQFMAVYNGYGETVGKYFALAQQFGQVNPMASLIYLKLVVGQTKILEKMAEFFNLGNPKDYVPYLGVLESQLTQQEAQMEAQSANVGEGTAGPIGPRGAMDNSMAQNDQRFAGNPGIPAPGTPGTVV